MLNRAVPLVGSVSAPTTLSDVTVETELPTDAPTFVARGVIALGLSVAVNLLARSLLDFLLPIPAEFQQFSAAAVVVFTALGAIGATVVYAFIANRYDHPVRTFRGVAFGALLLSFAPDLVLWVNQGSSQGVTAVGILSLMFLHVTAFASIVGALTWSPRPHGVSERTRERAVPTGGRNAIQPAVDKTVRLFRQN